MTRCRLRRRGAVGWPHRDGWLIFMRGGRAWYGTAEAAADTLLAGEHRGGIPPTQLTRPTVAKGLFPVLWAPAAT